MSDLSVRDVADLMPHLPYQCFLAPPVILRYAPSEEWTLRGEECTCLSLREEIAAALMLRVRMELKEPAEPAPQTDGASPTPPELTPTGTPLRKSVGVNLKSRRLSVNSEATREPTSVSVPAE